MMENMLPSEEDSLSTLRLTGMFLSRVLITGGSPRADLVLPAGWLRIGPCCETVWHQRDEST
jgi:hypothetical protein